MSRINFIRTLSIVVLTLSTQLLSAMVTYQVGGCKPRITNFTSISAALAATPAPNIVMVCPGTYKEQVVIDQPVNLEGVETTNSALATIQPPGGGLAANATSDSGQSVAAQIWVNNVTGPVNITNITVDATGNGVSNPNFVAGIFYQNSSGAVNQVVAFNQTTGGNQGIAIWLEGGASSPTVTVMNSQAIDFDGVGIFSESAVTEEPSRSGAKPADAQNTAVIKSNVVQTTASNASGIFLAGPSANTVSSNLVTAPIGIGSLSLGTLSGTISGNTVVNSPIGISAGADQDSVTGNKIVNSSTEGIELFSSNAAVQHNTILFTPIGIEFNCNANSNVQSNKITGSGTGLDQVPTTVTSTNNYYDVGTIRNGCSGSD